METNVAKFISIEITININNKLTNRTLKKEGLQSDNVEIYRVPCYLLVQERVGVVTKRMRFSREFIDEVKLHNDIVNVISEYVKLERRGSNFLGLCPFHKEKTPSFSVSPSKQFFYCFGCQRGGNVVNFISLAEGLDYRNSIILLADRAGIEVPEGNNVTEYQKQLLKLSLHEINAHAAKFYALNLDKSRAAVEYIKNRQISEDTISQFGIGYAPDSWNSLYDYLKQKGFNDSLLLQSGLVLRSKNGGMYDRFRNRIMFPIYDVMGKVIAFGGRVLDDSLPKYLNSPETLIYNKRRNLYALNFSRKSRAKQLIIVEGYMDVISLYQYGITNVVASLGTALTENQGRLLKKYCEEVIICYDSDAAGTNATLRGLDILNKIGCNVKVLQLPKGNDPDDFIKMYGPENFMRLINNALTLVEYKVEILKRDIDTDTIDGKIEFLNKLASILSEIDNLVERDLYIKKFARIFEIREESLNAEILKKKGTENNKTRRIRQVRQETSKQNEILSEELEKISHDEKMILSLLCIDNSVFNRVKKVIDVDFFQFASNRKIAERVFSALNENDEITVDDLFDFVNDNDRDEFAKIIYNECNCQDNYKAILDLIKRIQLIRLDKRKLEILDKLKDRTISNEEREILNKELKEIILRKR